MNELVALSMKCYHGLISHYKTEHYECENRDCGCFCHTSAMFKKSWKTDPS